MWTIMPSGQTAIIETLFGLSILCNVIQCQWCKVISPSCPTEKLEEKRNTSAKRKLNWSYALSEDFQLFGSLSIQVSVELMNMLCVTSCVVLKSNFHSFWTLMVWDSQDLLYSGIQRVLKELSGSGVLKTEIRGFTKSKDIGFEHVVDWLTNKVKVVKT